MSTAQAVPSVPPLRRRLRGQEVVHYPESDGKPMAAHDPQYRCITDTRFSLEQHLSQQDYVGADLLIVL